MNQGIGYKIEQFSEEFPETTANREKFRDLLQEVARVCRAIEGDDIERADRKVDMFFDIFQRGYLHKRG